MDEQAKRKLQGIAHELLSMCDDEINYIRVVADKQDASPYVCVHAFSAFQNDPIYKWSEFPNEGSES